MPPKNQPSLQPSENFDKPLSPQPTIPDEQKQNFIDAMNSVLTASDLQGRSTCIASIVEELENICPDDIHSCIRKMILPTDETISLYSTSTGMSPIQIVELLTHLFEKGIDI